MATQPKAMSSRLAAMKFMQRSSPTTAEPLREPAVKKQRLSNGSAVNVSPQATTQRSPPSGESRPFPNDRSDHEWYLSFEAPLPAAESPLRVISAGFSALDNLGPTDGASSIESEYQPVQGRKVFGKFDKTMKGRQGQNPEPPEDDSDFDGDEDEQEDFDQAGLTGVDALIAQGRKDAADRIRAERKAKRKADGAELYQLGEERRKKEIKLNRMSGISSGGGGRSSPQATCYTCGGKGHLKRDCPKAQSNGKKPKKSI